jgi:HSP20 family protein
MARSTSQGRQDDSTHQSDSATTNTTANANTAANANSASGESNRNDRERAIQTGRDRGQSTAVNRSQSSYPSTVYGTSNDPFQLMRRMSEDMDRLFENFGFGRLGLTGARPFGTSAGRDSWRGSSSPGLTEWTPQVETFRRGDKFVVRADLPGLRKEDVHVEVDDGVLTISGERTDEHEDDREDYYRSERSYGQFYRAIPLPEGVNADKCDATFKDGVLEVNLPAPKQEEHKPKQIQIR